MPKTVPTTENCTSKTSIVLRRRPCSRQTGLGVVPECSLHTLLTIHQLPPVVPEGNSCLPSYQPQRLLSEMPPDSSEVLYMFWSHSYVTSLQSFISLTVLYIFEIQEIDLLSLLAPTVLITGLHSRIAAKNYLLFDWTQGK